MEKDSKNLLAPEPEARQGDERKPEDEKTSKSGDPKSAEKNPQDPATSPQERGRGTPPEGDKGDASKRDIPSWEVALPPEFRRVMTQDEIDKVPEAYRKLVEEYQRHLLEHSRESGR